MRKLTFPLLVENQLTHASQIVNNLEELKITIQSFRKEINDICVMAPLAWKDGNVDVWDCDCRHVKQVTGLQF